MSDPEKMSVPNAEEKLGAAETDPTGSSSEANRDVEVLPQPKQQERVPRSQRRGLLVSLALIPEITEPYQYSNGMKWLFTAIVASAGMTSSTGSSIFYRKYT